MDIGLIRKKLANLHCSYMHRTIIWNNTAHTWREIYEKWIGMKSDLKIKYEETGFTMHTRR